ncbi:hypothetical protein DdX_08136 [Ditylenchus destructor]|uniref:Uncharacterized protein n=1 Tax=Ditylenchus destructor TaxID=166010 RepID=A0AAD4R7B1_9BILA|nr:hypothetical protein DdX_08136 [Ditylenchus destructor]
MRPGERELGESSSSAGNSGSGARESSNGTPVPGSSTANSTPNRRRSRTLITSGGSRGSPQQPQLEEPIQNNHVGHNHISTPRHPNTRRSVAARLSPMISSQILGPAMLPPAPTQPGRAAMLRLADVALPVSQIIAAGCEEASRLMFEQGESSGSEEQELNQIAEESSQGHSGGPNESEAATCEVREEHVPNTSGEIQVCTQKDEKTLNAESKRPKPGTSQKESREKSPGTSQNSTRPVPQISRQNASNSSEPLPNIDQVSNLLGRCQIQYGNKYSSNIRVESAVTVKKEFGIGAQQASGAKEIWFDPPWESRVGQLQNAVAVLKQFSATHLQNRGAIIVRCWAQSSGVYMDLVYSLIFQVIKHLGPKNLQPLEVRPILLNKKGTHSQNPPASASHGQPIMSQNPSTMNYKLSKTTAKEEGLKWTDVVLVRVKFESEDLANKFRRIFNKMASDVFDKMTVRIPFVHPDLTRPERDLRFRLQDFCRQSNSGTRQMGRNARTDGFMAAPSGHYFHDGVQLFKKSVDGTFVSIVKLDVNSEIQHLHSVVATLKKYAQLYQDKKNCAIIQNFPSSNIHDSNPTADLEQIRSVVYQIVNSDEFRASASQCQIVPVEISRVARNRIKLAGQISPPELVRIRFGSHQAASCFIKCFAKWNSDGNMKSYGDSSSISTANPARKGQPFAHRDLTPPELALRYSLRDFCKEKNSEDGNPGCYFYQRHYKIFEKFKIGH